MNNIIISDISDPNQAQPYLGYSLQFHQDATKEALKHLAIQAIGSSYSTSTVYVLWGCVRTGAADGAGSGAAAVSAGAIFYNGEVYTVSAFSTTNIAGQTLYSALSVTNASFDPVTFSNGASFNVHNIRQWLVSQANSGSNAQSLWVYINASWSYVGGAGQPSFATNWANAGLLGDPVGFKIDGGNFLVLRGACATSSTTSGTIFTLPVGYRPSVNIIIPCERLVNSSYVNSQLTILTTGAVSTESTTAGSTYGVFLNNVRIPLD